MAPFPPPLPRADANYEIPLDMSMYIFNCNKIVEATCFLFLSLLATLVFLKDSMYLGNVANKWARIYLLNLRLNIFIGNDSSRGIVPATLFPLVQL